MESQHSKNTPADLDARITESRDAFSKTINEFTDEIEKLGIKDLQRAEIEKIVDASNNVNYLLTILQHLVRQCVKLDLQDPYVKYDSLNQMMPTGTNGFSDKLIDMDEFLTFNNDLHLTKELGDNDNSKNDHCNLVIFGFRDSLGEKYYGIEIKYIQKVVLIEKITELSDTCNDVKGIIHHEGNLISLIDIKERLGISCKLAEKPRYLIVLNFNKIHTGILVDDVHYAFEVTPQTVDIHPSQTAKYIKKIIRVDDKTISLIDTVKILHKIDEEHLERLK